MERRLSQGEAVPYRGRRRSLADIKINLFPSQGKKRNDQLPPTTEDFTNKHSSVPEQSHSFVKDCANQNSNADLEINLPKRQRARERRKSIAVDDVRLLKRGTSPEANTDRRKWLIENAVTYHNNLSVNNLKRPRRASYSHVLPMKAACSNVERVSDNITTARKLLSEIEKQRQTEHSMAKHQTPQHDISCGDEETNNSGQLPTAVYELKTNMLKDVKNDKLIDVNRNTMLTSLGTSSRRSSGIVLPTIRVQCVDTPVMDIINIMENTKLSSNPSSKCPSLTMTDTWNSESRSREQSRQSTSWCSTSNKHSSTRSRSVECTRRRRDSIDSEHHDTSTNANRTDKPGHNFTISGDCLGSRRTEERIKLRHDHTQKLQKLLKAMEEEMPTQARLQLQQMRQEYKQ